MDNNVVNAILGRRSIRRYEDRPVEKEKIDALIRCAFAAPSAGNGRPVHFVVIRDRVVLDGISKVHPYGTMLAQAPVAVVICADKDKNPLSQSYWEQDCAAAMENLLIAAHSMDLGAVWLGVCHLPDEGAEIRSMIHVPPHIPIMGIASIGYPDEEKRPHSGDPGERLHLERWQEMRLDHLAECIDAEVIYGQDMLSSIEIDQVYGADLMSDVLAFATPGSLLLTGLTNIQIVRTAQMMDLPAVIFVRGKYPQKEAVDLAVSLDMPVLVSHKSMFETCGILFREGLQPCSIEKRQAP